MKRRQRGPSASTWKTCARGSSRDFFENALRDPDRSPDIGEPRLHPTAGATAVGVRKLLIAFNIHLNTSDISIAKKIAKAIRFSSGGLRHVKAIGVDLKSRGIAQVSINLTDFEQTPLHRVFEMVKREAQRYGCSVTGSEIVGLVPRKAIELAAEYYLQLENFSPSRILENRLAIASGAGHAEADVRGTDSSVVLSLLESLRETSRVCAQRIKSEPGERRVSSAHAELDAAEANLEVALAATHIFEEWMQLEAQAAPSILPEARMGRSMAMAAARSALENVELNVKAVQEFGHDLTSVSGFKSRIAAIEARLSKDPEAARGMAGSEIESLVHRRRK